MIRRHDSVIVQTTARFLVPFIQVFAVYVLFHGHYSPGGGFQAGVLIGASFILEFLVGSRRELKLFSIRREFIVAALGVFIFLFIGMTSLFYGKDFFNYGAIELLASKEAYRRYWAILLAEVGVTFAVAMSIVVIFHVLAFLPERMKENS